MRSLWFIVPAHGRVNVARVCLRQLRRTCDQLADRGIRASAVVIATDRNLDTAREIGFGTIERENRPLGRRWNDGFQLAGEHGVDFIVPCGSDDWLDPALFQVLPEPDEVRCSRLSAVVDERGRRLSTLRITYEGGDGIRIYPAALLEPCRYRPIQEDKARAMDTSLLKGVSAKRGRPPRFVYFDAHPLQIVDWKTSANLNSYEKCLKYAEGRELDPWSALADLYPAEALEEMQAVYRGGP